MRSLCYIVFDKSSYYISPVEQDFTDIVMDRYEKSIIALHKCDYRMRHFRC